MRSVPHRVVCLLGLDDGTFPRKATRDGDDLLLAQPHVGDRDARTEDRQLLLDALLAAQDRLIVTYTGNDERTNLPRPPAVPVGELLDLVGDGVKVKHPLQPFDPRNFTGTARSFDRVMLEGAKALDGPRITAAAVPRSTSAAARAGTDRPRGPREVRRAPGPRVPAPAARDQRRRLLERGRRRAPGRARQPRALERRRAAADRAAARDRGAHGDPRRDRARLAAARPAREAGRRRALAGRRRDRARRGRR